MLFSRIFCAILLLISVVSSAEILSNFYNEEPCAEQQGNCVLENECPHSVEGKFLGLCRNQRADGAVCCKNFPQKDLNCFQLHNECKPNCTENLNIGRKGCLKGTTCCALV